MRISDWSSDVCSSDLAILASSLAGSTSIFIIFRTPIKSSAQYFLCTHKLLTYCARNGTHLPLHVWVLASHLAAHPYSWRSILGSCAQRRSEEHTSELQSLMRISYAVFCLKKKKKNHNTHVHHNT